MTRPPNRKATDSFFLLIFSDGLFFPLILLGNGQVTTSCIKPYSTEVSQVVQLPQDGTSIHVRKFTVSHDTFARPWKIWVLGMPQHPLLQEAHITAPPAKRNKTDKYVETL